MQLTPTSTERKDVQYYICWKNENSLYSKTHGVLVSYNRMKKLLKLLALFKVGVIHNYNELKSGLDLSSNTQISLLHIINYVNSERVINSFEMTN